ncbi:MAG: hypothetical protein NTY68_02985, partial [Candidatus Micrarchaeota archaeon]|nr:hypothetical protein [Candidatus Micrarchaeota archaeon]
MIQTLAFPAKKTSMPRMNKELFEGNAVKRPKEGVERRKFNNAETELIIKTREKMVLEGKNDTDISIVLGQLLGRNRRSMHTKLMIMVKMGKMPKNPNVTEIKKFDYSEIETVTAVRAELIGKCKDSEIIRILADKLGRNEGSIEGLIRKMILKKKFGENPNRQVKFSD